MSGGGVDPVTAVVPMHVKLTTGRQPRLSGGQRLLAALLVLAVLAAAGVVLGVRALISTPTNTITADFTEAPGVYVGNHVDVLGIPVGTVTRITPSPTHVAVTMQVDRSVKVPAQAVAALEAPRLVC